MASKVILWDFDGTLAYREGMWGGTLIEILQAEEPDRRINRDQLRPHLQSGFPWHTPEKPHPAIRDATTWWRMLMPVFERAFAAQVLSDPRASELAAHVPAQFCSPARWKLFDDTVPTLSSLARQGSTHVSSGRPSRTFVINVVTCRRPRN